MTRKELQKLAGLRLREAEVLLENGYPDGAYYLAGYAVECAIKSCIARQTVRHEFPDLKRARESFSHDLMELVRVAQLTDSLYARQQDRMFQKNWEIVRKWSVEQRYERRAQPEAASLIKAIQDRRYGILRWLRLHW